MTGYLVAAVVIVGLVAVYFLLSRITSEGGTSDRDATAIANQVLGEADAYRGSRSPDDSPLDGQIRIAPPTQDGGAP
jgi:hypothetical protein